MLQAWGREQGSVESLCVNLVGCKPETLDSGLEGLCVFMLAERHMVCYRLDLEHWFLC